MAHDNRAAAQQMKERVAGQMQVVEAQVQAIAADFKQQQQPNIDRVTQLAQKLWTKYTDFSRASPALAAFVSIQLVLAAVPLALFLGFAIGTLATILVCAAVVSLTIIFFAACVLGTVLTFTFCIGIIVFANAASAYLALKWISQVRNKGLQAGTQEFIHNIEPSKLIHGGESSIEKTEDKLAELSDDVHHELPNINAAA